MKFYFSANKILLATIFIIFSAYILELRHIIYIVFFISTLYYFMYSFFRGKYILKNVHPFDKIFLALSFVILLSAITGFNNINVTRYLEEAFFIFTPLISIILISSVYNYYEEIKINNILLIYLFLCFVFILMREGNIFSDNLYEMLVASKSNTETTLAFVIGAVAIYFITTKKYILFVLSLPFVLISSKRIVYLGIVICVFIHICDIYFNFNRKWIKKSIPFIFVFFNIIYLIFAYHLSMGDYNNIIEKMTGISPSLLFMGRLKIYRYIFSKLNGFPLFGYGLGYTSYVLEQHLSGSSLNLMHSDIIKYNIELGVIPYSLFVYYFSKEIIKSSKFVLIIVYYFVISLTDNINIFFEVMFTVYLIIFFINVYYLSEKNMSHRYILNGV